MQNKIIRQNKKYPSSAWAVVWFVFFMAAACMADQDQSGIYNCVTRFENGAINWSTGKITAIGKASPEDNRKGSHKSVPGSARADANRQIIEILKQIKINAALTVGEYASKNDFILAGMEKTARDAIIMNQYYTSALAVEIMIETSMFGGFLQLVLPEDILQIPIINPIIQQENIKVRGYNFYTGLIIDARGLGVEPVLNPVVVSEQGHEIYSFVFISREFAVQNGVCKYLCSMDQALKDKRTGLHPLVLTGLRKQEKPNATIVISMSDYRLLEKATERHTFLKECRVIIVKDQ
ncbi:conserved uncharacterized protein [Desulfobacula toluolica Tol2]|uniref:Conserved uncharacterized protein n=2 Tax=Desulfobacula toluolica TaxID=28223 RepID=K0NTZ5_DESTT|nr:conserved uncharacterized protein [Desulfobacula toluolica Tol2]